MLFQALDNKKECVGVYTNGDLLFVEDPAQLPSGLTRTWSYSNFMKDMYDVDYAFLYCGKTIEEVCPDKYRDRYNDSANKLKAFLRSFRLSKINLNDNCFFDMVPSVFLRDYAVVKNKICNYIFQN